MQNKRMQSEIEKALERKADIHKGDCGRVFILAGSPGMTGAACLASMGALRTGAGLVTVGVPSGLNPILEVKLTEAMTLPLPQTKSGSLSLKALEKGLTFAKNQDVVLIGPGLSQDENTKKFVREFLVNIDKPVVLDADGLNAIVDFTEILAKMKSSVIITPHIGEFSRLFLRGRLENKGDFREKARQVSLKFKCVVVLKSHKTVVIDGDEEFLNNTGNPGLATGGSGDVLSGMVAALVGQKVRQYDASRYAVYLHGLAADIAAREKTQVSLLPSDVIDAIPHALKRCGVQ
jgi:NAD(P)H-hydrate epimerase